jgi:hypothetical protein
MKTKACSHCICALCEDRGCVECALCKGRYKTDSCSEAFITPRKRKKTEDRRTTNRRQTIDGDRENGHSLSGKEKTFNE